MITDNLSLQQLNTGSNIDDNISLVSSDASSLVIACGALAKEILAIRDANNMQNILDIKCLPASLHNSPDKIADALHKKITENINNYSNITIAFADCGTGGQLQKVCEKFGINYIKGAHCYAFFAGQERFEQISNDEIATFYLTDYLVKHFETLIIKAYKLDSIPEMKNMLFTNYKRLVYLAQTNDSNLDKQAKKWAEYLGLSYEHIVTGYGELEQFIKQGRNNNG